MHIYTQTKNTRKTLNVNKKQNVCACVGVCVRVHVCIFPRKLRQSIRQCLVISPGEVVRRREALRKDFDKEERRRSARMKGQSQSWR